MKAQERYERSRALYKRGDFDGALAAVREAIKLAPDMAEAYNFEGWILSRAPFSDAVGAVAAFREAQRLRPDDPVSFSNLCDALTRAGCATEAVTIAEARTRDSFDATADNWLGWYHREHGDLDRAVSHSREATRRRPGWGIAWLNLAIALDRQGGELEALEAYRAAVRCGDSHDPKLAKRRIREIEQQMRARGQEPPEEPWRGIDGQPLGAEYHAIDRLLRERRFDEAIAAIEKLATTDGMATFYTMGMTERAAATAYEAGLRQQAKELADLAVRGGRDWASGSSSGAEGTARSYDLQQLIVRLSRFR